MLVETMSIMHSCSDFAPYIKLNSYCLGLLAVFDGWFALVFISVSTIICCKTLIFIKDC